MAKLEPFGWVFTPRIKELITIEVDKDPIVFCKDCKHRDPEDKKCDFSDVVSIFREMTISSALTGR